jgi:hypothetical protein
MDYFYTGVGSRSTPENILLVMSKLAQMLGWGGWTLRSGGAEGADSAFEYGASLAEGKREIYRASDANKAAMDLAATIHPAWHKCYNFAKQLHARNCFQVLGRDLKTPSKFLVCWTLNGADTGGTRTAIVLARNNGIDVFNLGIQSHLDHILKYMEANTVR